MKLNFPRFAERCFFTAFLLLAQGAAGAERIRDLIDDPRSYVDRTVTIEGEVTGALSLLVVKYFTLHDGTAAINVFTERPLPGKGRRIRVTGRVEELFSLGSNTLLILTEPKDNAVGPGTDRTALPDARASSHPAPDD